MHNSKSGKRVLNLRVELVNLVQHWAVPTEWIEPESTACSPFAEIFLEGGRFGRKALIFPAYFGNLIFSLCVHARF